MHLRIYSVVALVGLVAFAGCIDGGDGGSAQDGGDRPAVAEFDETTGAIKGTVQDSELLPIAGAQVGALNNESILTTTNKGGQFALNKLAPGEYQIVAQALGYESKGVRVNVVAGEFTEQSFILDPVPTDEPFHVTDIRKASVRAIMWKLTPECIYTDINTLVKTCGGIRFGCDPGPNCEVHYEDEMDNTWKTITAELDWEPQSGFTGRGFFYDVNAPNITRGSGGSINQADPYTFQKDSDEAPIVHRIDNPETLLERGIAEEDWYGDWFYRIFAGFCDLGNCQDGFGPDYSVMIDNVATSYFTIHFKEAAPSDFSALPDK